MTKITLVVAGIFLLFAVACSRDAKNEETAEYRIEEWSQFLEVPWSIAFEEYDPNDAPAIMVAERPGRVRKMNNGSAPIHTFMEVSSGAEEGLMGLELDPDFATNRFVYLSLAYGDGDDLFVKVIRMTNDEHGLSNEQILLDHIPATHLHAGCRIKFGPDGKLYITTGDATQGELAQDLNSLCGKILRINSDGSIPEDNPFPDSPVWSLGHRNPQGIAWTENGEMYSSEHGPSGFDGPGGGDEINHIVKGGNYGWPVVHHEESQEGMISPLAVYTPAEAPASLLIYKGDAFPQFKGNLFFGCLRGQGIMRVVLDPNNSDHVVLSEKLAGIDYGRIRDVVEGPDGFIYFSTSNRDGRGDPDERDDRIFRMVPKK